MNKNFNIDKIIKDKVYNFSYNDSPEGWDIVNNGISASNRKILYKKLAITTAIILTAVTLIFVSKNNFTKKIVKNKLPNIINNNTQIIEPSINKKNNNLSTKNNKTIITDNKKITKENKPKNKNVIAKIKKTKTTEQDSQEVINQPIKIINNIVIPNADFTTDFTKGCSPIKICFSPAEKVDSMIYYWNFGDGITSNEQSPAHIYTQSGKFTVSLTVKYFRTGKIISKSYQDLINVYAQPKSEFEYKNQGSNYYFTNKSNDNEKTIWLGFDNKIITEDSPTYKFSQNKTYNISLISINKFGCSDTLIKQIKVNSIEQINLFMPNAFTPDGDGINDYFGVTQPLEYKEFYLQIFDLQGNLLYLSNDKQKMWDGTNIHNTPVPTGKYIWKVLIKTQKGNEIQKSGYLNLIK